MPHRQGELVDEQFGVWPDQERAQKASLSPSTSVL
jgi:hypothetical protein